VEPMALAEQMVLREPRGRMALVEPMAVAVQVLQAVLRVRRVQMVVAVPRERRVLAEQMD
jgi:hypothetical protein